MTNQTHQFFATCPRGLEHLLADELNAIGAQAVTVTDGGVGFAGDLPLCYRANLESRIATRILWQVGRGRYATEEHLYDAAFKLDWPQWFAVGRNFMVKVTGVKCPLKSLEFATLRIKDAVCDRFRQAVNSRPYIDTKEPDVRIHAYLAAEDYIFYLDTSGHALFQRGLRQASIEAPLRENLAAGILKLSGWQPGQPLLDPMCGSGTFLLEAAMLALDIAPGSQRSFGFEKLKNFDEAAWKKLREQVLSRAKPVTFQKIYGSDADLRAVRISKQNLQEAGLLEAVQLSKSDIVDVPPPAGEGVLVANPPYGVRIGEDEELAALYPKIAETLKRKFAGWNTYFLTSDLRMPKLMRLTPSKRTPLFNGPLECRLFEIKMVAGSNRKEAQNKERKMPDSLLELRARINAFVQERDWEQFHSPKNLAMAMIVEAAEVVEHFQWSTEAESQDLSPEKREQVAHELADTFVYLLRIAEVFGIDLIAAANAKIDLNAKKYPVEKSAW